MNIYNNLAPLRILSVDDEKVNIEILQELLSEQNYITEFCSSGEACLRLSNEFFPDLILLNIMMEDIDGYEVCRRIKAREPFTRAKIILLSGKAMVSERLKGYAAGADDYIMKPFDHDELLAKIFVFKKLISAEKQLYTYNDDLQDKVRLQTQKLIKSEKLASIGQLAANVTHEINNSLCFITSNLDTLSCYIEVIQEIISQVSTLVSKPDHTAQSLTSSWQSIQDESKLEQVFIDLNKLVQETKDGTNRVSKIVTSLRSIAGTDDGNLQNGNFNDDINKSINLVWSQLKGKCEVNKSLCEMPGAMAYHDQLNQVFINLLVNASHAIDRHGKIDIKTTIDGDNAIIEISDNGCGIAEEVIPKLFDPFFTTKSSGMGTGLGLSISHHIIEKHHGQIEVASTVGMGTTFKIVLPLNLSETSDSQISI